MSPVQIPNAFEIMHGVWTGMTSVYTPGGTFKDTIPSQVVIYIQEQGSKRKLTYCEVSRGGAWEALDEEDDDAAFTAQARKDAEKFTLISFELTINGAHAVGGSNSLDVVATQTMPGIYHFQVRYKTGADRATYYANHYFVDPSQANIVGPLVRGGKTSTVIARHLSRVSHEVPDELKCQPARESGAPRKSQPAKKPARKPARSGGHS